MTSKVDVYIWTENKDISTTKTEKPLVVGGICHYGEPRYKEPSPVIGGVCHYGEPRD